MVVVTRTRNCQIEQGSIQAPIDLPSDPWRATSAGDWVTLARVLRAGIVLLFVIVLEVFGILLIQLQVFGQPEPEPEPGA